MLRQHQFWKCELVSITDAESAIDEHERMTACAEEVLKRLGLHFRTMTLCTGDMGFGFAARPTISKSGCRARTPIAKFPRARSAAISRAVA